MSGSIKVPNPININNNFNLYNFARQAGYSSTNRQYKDRIILDRTKVYWDYEEFHFVNVGGGGTITIQCPAGYTWFITYGVPSYRYRYNVRRIVKPAEFGNPFFEDGIEEKLGGERKTLGE